MDTQQAEQTPATEPHPNPLLIGEGDREAAGEVKAEGFSDEFQQAYNFAHEKGITTMDTIEKANMN